jgi:hypothetical protein
MAPSSHSEALPEPARLTTSGSGTRVRDCVIGVRMTRAEAEELRAAANALGQSPGGLLRAAYLAMSALDAAQEAHRG